MLLQCGEALYPISSGTRLVLNYKYARHASAISDSSRLVLMLPVSQSVTHIYSVILAQF